MSEIKLFGSYTSPYVRHCRIVLAQTEMPYTFVETDYVASDAGSPTKRVPYLHDGEVKLHDSMAIIHYLRQKSAQAFLATPAETERFALANTVLDTCINVFLLENSGFSDSENTFLRRQQARIDSGLRALNDLMSSTPELPEMSDADWRVACLLDWGLFRQRLNLGNTSNLRHFLSTIQSWQIFEQTAPNTAPSTA